MAGLGWNPITDVFGAEIQGLDLSAPISAADAKTLRELWLERGLLLMRGQEITDAAQVALTELFGTARVHVASDTHVSSQRELIAIAFSPDVAKESQIYDVRGRIVANWQPWHIDTIYTEEVEHGGILRAIHAAEGAYTGFMDRVDIYNRLPEALRRRADDVRVLYHLTPEATASPFNPFLEGASNTQKPDRIRRMEQRAREEFPFVSHPAVFTHPVTGRKTLNVSTLHAQGVEGMGKAEGDALLRELIAAMVDLGEPYFHSWKPHDILVWDNWRLLHSAEGTPVDATRKLYRSGIDGHYGLGRVATEQPGFAMAR